MINTFKDSFVQVYILGIMNLLLLDFDITICVGISCFIISTTISLKIEFHHDFLNVILNPIRKIYNVFDRIILRFF